MSNKSIYSLISAVALTGGLCFAGPAFAVSCDGSNANPGPCDEVETNTIMASATLLGTLSTFLSVDGELLDSDLNPEDVEFFSFVLLTPSLVQLTTTTRSGESIGDSVLTLFNSVGTSLASNDDGGPDAADGYSQILFSDLKPSSTVLGPGTYFAKIEGKVFERIDPDTLLGTGEFIHEQPAYNLLIEGREVPIDGAPVPEPASLALLGSGLAGLALWRRKRA